MSQEREQSHASNQAQVPPQADLDLAPGRSSLSAKLEAPDKPLISGLIQRKAERDANGVADGADSAIATASSSSGTSLPGEIQRKFESSLGTDLSSVRVHTGGESQAAAHAVGAKAYTMGQDIHFGSGHFDPSSAAGEHLLAHEVAHTVQQRGGTPSRQNKLEVSAPQDAAEHEADRAADAMVSGGQASIGGFAGVQRQVFRDLDPSWYAKNASSAEQLAAKDMSRSSASMQVLGASNVGDANAAQAEIGKIQAQEENFSKALHSTIVADEVKAAYADNHHAEDLLSSFLSETQVQGGALGNFKAQYARLMLDFTRLSAMVSLSGISGDQSGGNFADQLVASQHLNAADHAAASKDSQNPDAAGSGVIATKRAELRDAERDMTTAANALGTNQIDMTTAQHEYEAACDDINSGLTPKSDPQAATDLKALQAKIAEIKAFANTIAGFVSKSVGAGIGGVVAGQINAAQGVSPSPGTVGTVTTNGTNTQVVTPPTSESAGSKWGASVGGGAAAKLPDVVGFVAGLPFQAALNEAQAKATAALESQLASQKNAQLNTLQAKKDAIRDKAKIYMDTAAALETSKNRVRSVTAELASAMDKTGGRNGKKFQTLGAFLGEADAYLAQSKATRDLGTEEKATAGVAKAKRDLVTLGTGANECKWWEVFEQKRVASDSTHWVLSRHDVHLPVGANQQSANGPDGANESIEQELARLDKNDAWITQMRDKIKAQFGF